VIGETSRDALHAVLCASQTIFWSAAGGWEDLLVFNDETERVAFESVSHEELALIYEPAQITPQLISTGRTVARAECGIVGTCIDSLQMREILSQVSTD
jgi:hypothetical protein